MHDIIPLLAAINDSVPVQSRLEPRRVSILSADENFEVSSKGIVKRRLTEGYYRDLVEEMYRDE